MIQRSDDRRGGRVELFGLGRQKFLVAQVDRQPVRRELLFGALEARFEAIERAVQRFHIAAGGDDPFDLEARDAADVVDRKRRERIVDGNRQRRLVLRNRDQAVPPGERAGRARS